LSRNRKITIKKWQGFKLEVRNFFTLIGFTSIALLFIGASISHAEQQGFIQIYLGYKLYGFSPLDSWLIVILIIFGLPIFALFTLIYWLKIIKITEE